MSKADYLFDPEEEKELRHQSAVNNRCTPELLTEFMLRTLKETGKSPDLGQYKREYGGILGAYKCAWKLMDAGEWEPLLRLRTVRDVLEMATERDVRLVLVDGQPNLQAKDKSRVTKPFLAALRVWKTEIVEALREG